jgi:hypothetical protein
MRPPSETSFETSVPLGMSDFRFEMGQEDWCRASGGGTPIATDYDGQDPSELTAPDSRSSQGNQSMGVPYPAGFVHGSGQDDMTSGPFYVSSMGDGSYDQNQLINPSWMASFVMETMTGAGILHDFLSTSSPFSDQAQGAGSERSEQSYDIASLPVPSLNGRITLKGSGKTGYLAPPGQQSIRNPLHSPRNQFYRDWTEAQDGKPVALSFAVPAIPSVGEPHYQLPQSQTLPFDPKAMVGSHELQVSALINLKTTVFFAL